MNRIDSDDFSWLNEGTRGNDSRQKRGSFSFSFRPGSSLTRIEKTMKKFLTAATIFVACGLVPAAVNAATPPTVVISEVAWAGSSKGTADEWLELTNVTDASIDLSGFTLEGAGTSGSALTIPAGSVIASHATFLISNYADTDAKSVLASPAQSVTTAVSLSNTNLGIALKDASGAILDRAGDGKTPKAGSSVAPFASMIRLDPTDDGTLAASWATATASSGFDAGTTDLGTPGILDFTFAPEPAPPTPEPAPQPTPVVPDATVTTPDVAPVVPAVTGTATDAIPPAETTVVTDPSTTIVTQTDVVSATEPVASTTDTPTTAVAPDPTTVTSVEPIPTTSEPVATSVEPVADTTTTTTDTTQAADPLPAIPTSTETVPIIEPAPAIVIASTPPGTLVVNEIYSAPPKGQDEWVEIANPYNNVIPLSGWNVREGSGKLTPLPDQLLGMGQFVLVNNPAGKLNNGGDTVDLLDPTNAVIDEVVYGTAALPAPKSDEALARGDDGKFVLTTTPTPDAQNAITAPIVPPKKSGATAVAPQTSTVIYETPVAETPAASPAIPVQPAVQAVPEPAPLPPVVELGAKPVLAPTPAAKPKPAASVRRTAVFARVNAADVQDLATGKKVTLVARVTAAPGPLGTETFAVEDDSGGLIVTRDGGPLPPLMVGDRLSLSGTVSVSHGLRRLRLAGSSGLTMLGHGQAIAATAVAIQDLDDGRVGALVTVAGEVTQSRGALMTVVEDDATLEVRLPTGSKAAAKGSVVSAAGILSSDGTALRLQLRSPEDLHITAPPAVASVDSPSASLPDPQAMNGLRLAGASAAVLLGLAAKHFIPLIKAHYASTRPLRLAP
jgi:hypothetical protein